VCSVEEYFVTLRCDFIVLRQLQLKYVNLVELKYMIGVANA